MKPWAVSTSAAFLSAATASAQTGLDLDRAYASQLRADAETRASFLGISQASGLTVSAMVQTRYVVNLRDEQSGVDLGDDDTTVGFSIPRAQIRLAGAVTDSITGHASFDFGSAETGSDGTASLLTAFADWAVSDRCTLRIGQWHNPIVAEEAVEAEFGLAVERSIVNEFFNPGYTQGVAATHTGDNWRFFLALSDGLSAFGSGSTANSPFNSPAESDWAVSARADLLISGTWDQFNAFSSWRGSNYGVKIGVGAHYQEQGDTNPSSGTWDVLGGVTTDEVALGLWSVDVQVKGDGWNFFAAYLGHHVDAEPTAGDLPSLLNHGVVVQGGLFVSDQVELFARYDALFLDSDLSDLAGTDEDDFHFLTAGVNYFLVPESHAARFTADVVYSFTDTDTLDALMGGLNGPATTGLLGASDGELLLRAQLTLVF